MDFQTFVVRGTAQQASELVVQRLLGHGGGARVALTHADATPGRPVEERLQPDSPSQASRGPDIDQTDLVGFDSNRRPGQRRTVHVEDDGQTGPEQRSRPPQELPRRARRRQQDASGPGSPTGRNAELAHRSGRAARRRPRRSPLRSRSSGRAERGSGRCRRPDGTCTRLQALLARAEVRQEIEAGPGRESDGRRRGGSPPAMGTRPSRFRAVGRSDGGRLQERWSGCRAAGITVQGTGRGSLFRSRSSSAIGGCLKMVFCYRRV